MTKRSVWIERQVGDGPFKWTEAGFGEREMTAHEELQEWLMLNVGSRQAEECLDLVDRVIAERLAVASRELKVVAVDPNKSVCQCRPGTACRVECNL